MGAAAISPDVEVKPKKRQHSPEEEVCKKFKPEITVPTVDPVKAVPNEKIKCKRERPTRADPITEEMLYGPFDFSKHRNGHTKSSRRTQNLAPRLQDIVEDSSRKFTLTPSRLKCLNP